MLKERQQGNYIFVEVDLSLFFWVYILHVQDLCELRKRSIPLFDLVFLMFLFLFLFWEKRDIKWQQKLTIIFNKGGLWETNRAYRR